MSLKQENTFKRQTFVFWGFPLVSSFQFSGSAIFLIDLWIPCHFNVLTLCGNGLGRSLYTGSNDTNSDSSLYTILKTFIYF